MVARLTLGGLEATVIPAYHRHTGESRYPENPIQGGSQLADSQALKVTPISVIPKSNKSQFRQKVDRQDSGPGNVPGASGPGNVPGACSAPGCALVACQFSIRDALPSGLIRIPATGPTVLLNSFTASVSGPPTRFTHWGTTRLSATSSNRKVRISSLNGV